MEGVGRQRERKTERERERERRREVTSRCVTLSTHDFDLCNTLCTCFKIGGTRSVFELDRFDLSFPLLAFAPSLSPSFLSLSLSRSLPLSL